MYGSLDRRTHSLWSMVATEPQLTGVSFIQVSVSRRRRCHFSPFDLLKSNISVFRPRNESNQQEQRSQGQWNRILWLPFNLFHGRTGNTQSDNIWTTTKSTAATHSMTSVTNVLTQELGDDFKPIFFCLNRLEFVGFVIPKTLFT